MSSLPSPLSLSSVSALSSELDPLYNKESFKLTLSGNKLREYCANDTIILIEYQFDAIIVYCRTLNSIFYLNFII